MKTILTNMFGFVWQKPIYYTLSKMRVIHILALHATYVWADALINKIPALTPHSDAVIVGVYFANFMALIGVWWTSIKDMREPHDHD